MIHSFLNRHGASFHRFYLPLFCSCCVLFAFVLNRHGASFHRLLVLFVFSPPSVPLVLYTKLMYIISVKLHSS